MTTVCVCVCSRCRQILVCHSLTTPCASISITHLVTNRYSPDYYPPTVNDPELYEGFSKHVAALVAEDGQVTHTESIMAAEDFSFLAEAVPSTFFLLGSGSGTNPPTNYGLHHPHFALDESVLPRGVELHVNLALRALQKLRVESGEVVQEAA